MRKIAGAILLLVAMLAGAPAFGQWQVPANSIPVGRGPGVTGFNSIAPGSAGNCLTSNGTSPSFTACPASNVWSPTVTTTRSVTSADKNKTLLLGGSAYYTVSLAAASGFDADFCTSIYNSDTGRGKLISPNGVTPFILWPLQWNRVCNNGSNVWVNLPPQRWIKPSAQFFVDQAQGSDSNDCLATTTGACLSIQKAWDLNNLYVDQNGAQTSITVSGAYTLGVHPGETSGINFVYSRVGSSEVTITGTGSNVFTCTNSITGFTVREPATVTFSNFKAVSDGTCGVFISATQAATVDFGPIEQGSMASADFVNCSTGAHCNFLSNITVSGNSNRHIVSSFGAYVNYGGITVTCVGSPASVLFAAALDYGVIAAGPPTLSGCGSATGQKYQTDGRGYITGTPTFPGSTVGIPAIPSLYNVVESATVNFGDANFNIAAATRTMRPTAGFTAPRVGTLPQAVTVNAGHTVCVNVLTSISATNTLTIAPFAGDSIINGNPAISVANTNICLTSDGITQWWYGVSPTATREISGETALDGSNPTPVATGLTTITGCALTIKSTSAPGLGTSVVTYGTSGATLNMYGWKPTGAGDATLIASTGTDTIGWKCTGSWLLMRDFGGEHANDNTPAWFAKVG